MDVVIALTLLLVLAFETSLEAKNDRGDGRAGESRLEGPPRTSDEDDQDYEYDEEDEQNAATTTLTPEIRKRKQSARPPGFGPPKEHKQMGEQRSKRQSGTGEQSQLLKHVTEAKTHSASAHFVSKRKSGKAICLFSSTNAIIFVQGRKCGENIDDDEIGDTLYRNASTTDTLIQTQSSGE
uniref:Uncharacterized protein n=1 Tax=Ascaris lumbricoides TaxID=6252 RepID=A0A9J2PMX1_ASCLU